MAVADPLVITKEITSIDRPLHDCILFTLMFVVCIGNCQAAVRQGPEDLRGCSCRQSLEVKVE